MQTYDNYRVFVSVETEFDYEYVKPLTNGRDRIYKVNGGSDYDYNLHCNKLKDKVEQGYFFFLDDDDELCDIRVLERLAKELTRDAVICQFNRAGWLKPSNEMIDNEVLIEGQIGMPCLVLNYKYKNIADITADVSGDYHWIKEVVKQVSTKWIKLPLVSSSKRNHGRTI